MESKPLSSDETWGERILPKVRREHAPDWFDVDDDELIEIINGTILNPDDHKRLDRGREAYWNEEEGAVVITDANTDDGGTAFRPTDGKDYFDGL